VPSRSAVPSLASLGWDDDWRLALDALGDPALVPGRVSRVDRGVCTVMTGTDEVRVSAAVGIDTAVGDWVAFSPVAVDDARPRISAVLPRRDVFRRADARTGRVQVAAANIDTVLLCTALDGRLSLRHLERYLAVAREGGATPVVLITKSDAVTSDVVEQAVAAVGIDTAVGDWVAFSPVAVDKVAEGVAVVVVSSTTGEGLENLAPHLAPGRTLALLGLSGAGKSTLVNLLAGDDILRTGTVRKDGSGRHTTTHRQLVPLPGGALLIDTPGMRSLSVVEES
jgi:ribosome biogenesis GTPase